MRRLAITAALALVGFAIAAQAHPRLLSATPAPNAIVAKPGRVDLHFSEKLVPEFSGADLMMMANDGKARPPIKIASIATTGPDGRTLMVTPKAPLGTGRYGVAWHVVSIDTHRVTGNYGFAVK